MIPLTLLRKIARWLDEHSIVRCVECGRLLFSKNARVHAVSTIVSTTCPACEAQLHRMWRKP